MDTWKKSPYASTLWNESSVQIFQAISTSINKAQTRANETAFSNLAIPAPADWFRADWSTGRGSSSLSSAREAEASGRKTQELIEAELVNVDEECDVEILREKFMKALMLIADLKLQLTERFSLSLATPSHEPWTVIQLTRDRQEVELRKLKYAMHHLREEHLHLLEQAVSQREDLDTLHIKCRLMSSDLIHTRDVNYDLRQENRDLRRSLISYERQIFGLEDYIARQSRTIIAVQSKQQLEEVTGDMDATEAKIGHPDVEERWLMVVEDLSSRLMRYEELEASLRSELSKMANDHSALVFEHHKLDEMLTKLHEDYTILMTRINSSEKKVCSFTLRYLAAAD
jgi:hypothetical protein